MPKHFGDNLMRDNHNKQAVGRSKIEHDFDELARVLRGTEVVEADIYNLGKAIFDDTRLVDHQARAFGPGVEQWIRNMLAKSQQKVWQIEMNVANVLLVTALSSYYGWFYSKQEESVFLQSE